VGRGDRSAEERATALDPDYEAAWSVLGYVYETRNQPDEAIKIYKEAIRRIRTTRRSVERLGDLLIRLGRIRRGPGRGSRASPNRCRATPRVWMKLGAIHYEQKHWDQAVAAFRQAS
jgi:tetratricopeptide (TPR) repeat protein